MTVPSAGLAKVLATTALVLLFTLAGCKPAQKTAANVTQPEASSIASSAATSTPVATETVTPTVPAAAATPTVVTPPPAPGPSTAEDGKHFTLITKFASASGGVKLTADYLQLFVGKAAEKEAAKRGDTVENDYYIVNDNKKLRTFPVSSSVKIVLHPGEGPQFSHTFTIWEFKSMINSGDEKIASGKHYLVNHETAFYVTIKNGAATRIEQFWVP